MTDSPPSTAGSRLLLVDDEPRLAAIFQRSLAAHGHDVTHVMTCEQAVATIAAGPFDVLVLDINLPDATGWDVLRQIHRLGRDLPTIVFSAVPASIERLREFAPAGLLQKPFPIDALVGLVERVLAPSAAGDADPSIPEPSDAGDGTVSDSRGPDMTSAPDG